MSRPTIVTKFGGTSASTAPNIEGMASDVADDPDTTLVVVSAPGKLPAGQKSEKITTLLIGLYHGIEGRTRKDIFDEIATRYRAIVEELGVRFDIGQHLRQIWKASADPNTYDFVLSRGEYLNARILAIYLGWTFLDAKFFIVTDQQGRVDMTASQWHFDRLVHQGERYVIPGFYGATPEGTIVTFARGGSDRTAAIVAVLARAKLCVIRTDVDGMWTADPNIVSDARPILEITAKDALQFASNGAAVIDPMAIRALVGSDIPMRICKTGAPIEQPGTLVYSDGRRMVHESPSIIGIAVRHLTVIIVEKITMFGGSGFIQQLSGVFARRGISIDHIPSSETLVNVVFAHDPKCGTMAEIIADIQQACEPDRVYERNERMAIINVVVGSKLLQTPGVLRDIAAAAASVNANIEIVDQAIDGSVVKIGVKETEYERVLRAIHNMFFPV